MTVRVLLADDQELVRTGFRLILESEPDIEVVGEVSDGRAAVEAAIRDRPDVVLMDIQMPGVDGIEATRRLTARLGTYAPRILILTTFDLDEYVFESLRAGANGFLLKDLAASQLGTAIRMVAAGEALLAPTVTRRLIEHFTTSATMRPPSGFDDLTPREVEIFRLLARGKSNAEIADDVLIGEATVKTHVSRLLTKLGLRDRVQAVVLAYETGIVKPGG